MTVKMTEKQKQKLNEKLDVWFGLLNETVGFEEDILKPLHDRLATKIFQYNPKTKLWDWTGKNLRLTYLEKNRLSYFNETLDGEYDQTMIKILKFYNLLWEENEGLLKA